MGYVVKHFRELADKRKMRVMGRWLKPRLKLKIMEHSLLAVTMLMIPFYIQEEQLIGIQGWMVMIPLTLSCFIGLMVVKYDQTPCNATLQLTLKTVNLLRLIMAANVVIKIDGHLDWEWSTTFWPYWCSFTIQAVLVVATMVIFLNTLAMFFRAEAKVSDLIGSLWGTLMSSGFMLSTLQPILVVIQIYDSGDTIPEHLFNENIQD